MRGQASQQGHSWGISETGHEEWGVSPPPRVGGREQIHGIEWHAGGGPRLYRGGGQGNATVRVTCIRGVSACCSQLLGHCRHSPGPPCPSAPTPAQWPPPGPSPASQIIWTSPRAGVEGPGDEGRRPRAGSAQGRPSGPARKVSRSFFSKQL